MHAGHPVLYFDGICRFCDAAVQMVLKKDSEGVVHFAALQSPTGRQLVEAHPELKSIDSVIFVEEDGRISVKSEAVMRIAARTGGWWRIVLAGRLLPRALRDWMYDAFARRRYSIFGKNESCMVPAPEVRSRFIDQA